MRRCLIFFFLISVLFAGFTTSLIRDAAAQDATGRMALPTGLANGDMAGAASLSPGNGNGSGEFPISPHVLAVLKNIPGVVVFDPDKPDIRKVRILDPRPMQFEVGMREVAEKREKLQTMKPHEVHDYLKARPLPSYISPKTDKNDPDRHNTNDHTHLNRAAWEAGIEYIYVSVIADFSKAKMSEGEFLDKLVELGLAHNRDRFGNLHDPRYYHENVRGLGDYPERSVASNVEKLGGFNKVNVPDQEFFWADFFRDHLKIRPIFDDFEKVVQEALILAKSPLAKDLPGYSGPE